MTPELDYRAIRTRVNEGLKKQKFRARLTFFLVSLFMFLVFVFIGVFMIAGQSQVSPVPVGSVIADASSSSGAAGGAMLMFIMGWLTSIMFQGISLFFDTKAGEDSMRERLVAREIGKEMMQMGTDEVEEKRKHMMRLSDDGELQEVVEDEATAEIKRQRQA